MPQLRLRDKPSQGRKCEVYVSLLANGDRNEPVFQTLASTGFHTLYTVVNAVAAASYIATIAGVAYTVVATATDTKASIARALIALIEAGTTGAKCYNLRLNAGNWEFRVHRATTFTAVNTGTTTPADLTVAAVAGAATALAAGVTSIALAWPLIGRIAKGQYLRFDLGTTEVTVEVNAQAEIGATSLTVTAIPEAIPAAALAQFPPEFLHRTAIGISTKYDFSGFATINTGGFEDGVQTKGSAEASLDGIYFELDPAYRTICDEAADGPEFAEIVLYPAPKTGWSGRKRFAIMGITSREEPVSVDSFVSAKFTAKILTHPVDTIAAPLP